MDKLLDPTGHLGYTSVYHINGPDWSGPTGLYRYDYQSPLAPYESTDWQPIYLWAIPTYVGDYMNFAMKPYTPAPPPTNRAYTLELLYVPPEITNAPPVGTTWAISPSVEVLIPLPAYRTTDPYTGYQLKFTISPESDPCQGYVRGDTNCDGVVDFGDINSFVAALNGSDAWKDAVAPPALCTYLCVNDINRDGTVSFADINPFVACLTGGCP